MRWTVCFGFWFETPFDAVKFHINFIFRQPPLKSNEWNVLLKHVQQLREDVFDCISVPELYQVFLPLSLFHYTMIRNTFCFFIFIKLSIFIYYVYLILSVSFYRRHLRNTCWVLELKRICISRKNYWHALHQREK